MKYLLLALLLTSCTYRGSPKTPDPKFHFGESVSINDGFYKGNTGSVYEAFRCVAEHANGDPYMSWCYTIQIVKNHVLTVAQLVHEESLAE